ncbi:hypothetical protein E2C01_015151 [Portunus trituberculatus]|uniref:Junctophilin-3 n=1 Tax=Portunus trituberculatus TaxID=210409 RepID=A0A5B7DM74_PORTR|nr:hypothetical protein [Portunus trituberculatus]
MQKEDIGISRTATARGKAEQADIAAAHARNDSDMARIFAKQYAPDFHQPGVDVLKAQLAARGGQTDVSKLPPPRSRDENSGPRSQSVYVRGSVDDYMGRGDALGPQDMDATAASPGGGFANFGPGDQADYGGMPSSRRTSMNPGEGRGYSNAQQQYQDDGLMGNAVDQSRSSARGPARSGGKGGHEQHSFSAAVMNDRFDHYNRPPSRAPSRDRSVDRFASRGQTPVPSELINPRSRAPSAQRTTAQDWTPDSGVYEDEAVAPISGSSRRPSRPPSIISGEAPPLTGNGSVGGGFTVPYTIPATPQEAEKILRQRACGQEIPPCPPTPGQGTVKRTESLYINPIVRRQAQVKAAPPAVALKRKKSLPDAQALPVNMMSREEAAVLSSAQRHEVRRQAEEAAVYRANPLLYLTSPAVQDWFSRQRLVMLILFLNLSLALMFFNQQGRGFFRSLSELPRESRACRSPPSGSATAAATAAAALGTPTCRPPPVPSSADYACVLPAHVCCQNLYFVMVRATSCRPSVSRPFCTAAAATTGVLRWPSQIRRDARLAASS